MENKIKKAIIIIIFIIIIIAIIIAVQAIINYNEELREYEIWGEDIVYEDDSKERNISLALESYQHYIKEKDATAIIALLDRSFITDNGITKSNLFEKLEQFYSNVDLEYTLVKIEEHPNDLYVAQIYDLFDESIVYYVVTLNLANNTFSIKPCKEGEVVIIKSPTYIERNTYNRCIYVSK